MKRPGKPIKIKEALKAMEYLRKGLTEAEVARVMKTTRQQVNRWVQYEKKGILQDSQE